MSSILDQDIMFLPGVGPKKKEILSKELGINSYVTCWNTTLINM